MKSGAHLEQRSNSSTKRYATFCRFGDARQNLEQSAFTCAVAADDTDDLTLAPGKAGPTSLSSWICSPERTKNVGWSARPTIARELVLDAVLMTVRGRRPCRTVMHSEQGSQYCSDHWRRFCKTNHLEPSISRRENCWDNAVLESFFSSLKKITRQKEDLQNSRACAGRGT